jgi:hypothetical protein
MAPTPSRLLLLRANNSSYNSSITLLTTVEALKGDNKSEADAHGRVGAVVVELMGGSVWRQKR